MSIKQDLTQIIDNLREQAESNELEFKKGGHIMTCKVLPNIRHIMIVLALCFVLTPWASSSASVRTETDSAINYKISYPVVYLDNNQEAQDRINNDIYKYIKSFKKDYYNGMFIDGSLRYEVKYEDDDVLSIMLIDYRYTGGAHGHEWGAGLNYSKKTGQRLPLPYFVRLRPDDASKVFSFPICNNKNQLLLRRAIQGFVNRKIERKSITGNYYLLGNGAIALIYQPSQLAGYREGITHIEISAKYVDYFNRRNHD